MDKKRKAAGYRHPGFNPALEGVDPVHYELAAADAMHDAITGISNAPVKIEGTDDLYVMALPNNMMQNCSVEEITEYVRMHFKN